MNNEFLELCIQKLNNLYDSEDLDIELFLDEEFINIKYLSHSICNDYTILENDLNPYEIMMDLFEAAKHLANLVDNKLSLSYAKALGVAILFKPESDFVVVDGITYVYKTNKIKIDEIIHQLKLIDNSIFY